MGREAFKPDYLKLVSSFSLNGSCQKYFTVDKRKEGEKAMIKEPSLWHNLRLFACYWQQQQGDSAYLLYT